MSNRELAKQLIDQISDAKLLYVIQYLQGAILPNGTPNAKVMAETQLMIQNSNNI